MEDCFPRLIIKVLELPDVCENLRNKRNKIWGSNVTQIIILTAHHEFFCLSFSVHFSSQDSCLKMKRSWLFNNLFWYTWQANYPMKWKRGLGVNVLFNFIQKRAKGRLSRNSLCYCNVNIMKKLNNY